MHTVFQRVRAGQIEVQIPGERVAEEADPWIRANSAAFLILERERRAAAARLGRHYWRRGDRYRDLALVTRLTHLEYEHLAGRVSRKAGGPSPAAGRPALNGDMPADWARPWGTRPMLEMRVMLIHYQGQGNRLARRLPARTVARATADAERYRDRVCSRFERAMGEWSLELERELAWAPEPRRPAGKPRATLAARARERLEAWGWTSLAKVAWTSLAAKPWGSLRVRAAAVAAVAVAAVGIGITVTRGPSASSSSNSHAAVASVPQLPLAALSKKIPGESHPARDQSGGQHARHRSTAPEQTPTEPVAPPSAAPRGGGRTAVAAPPIAPPAPAPATAVAPSPAPAPSPATRSQPATGSEAKSRPGPVAARPGPLAAQPRKRFRRRRGLRWAYAVRLAWSSVSGSQASGWRSLRRRWRTQSR